MNDARQVADEAAPAETEWESDRKAWNLPKRPITKVPETSAELDQDELRLVERGS
jgi:hypothetical protein